MSIVHGGLRVWLRLEGMAAFAVSTLLYARSGGGWGTFLLLILVPDLSMIGYAAGARVGAAAYNVVHSYTLPLALAALGLVAGSPRTVGVALVWTAHIGIDRAAGYGLKYPTSFQDTHLGRIGGTRRAGTSDAAIT
jgi:hypothetical protein